MLYFEKNSTIHVSGNSLDLNPDWLDNIYIFFNWDSPHARLNSHYEAWSYKKGSTKRITGYRKSV